MSNIHGFHNLAPARPQQQAAQPPPGGRGYIQHGGGLPAAGGMSDYAGISMMQPAARADGLPPTLSQRIFPGMTKYSMTTVVAVVNVLMFIITLIVGSAKFDGAFVKGNDMGGPSAVTLCNMGGKWEPSIRDGHVWRLFTQTLLHAGIMHILGNLFFLLRFGYVTEARWGIYRWTGLYLLAGIMASLWSTALGPKSVSVGASGALFGLVGADFAYLAYNWAEIPDNKTELCMLTIVTVINFLFGISSNIDNWAHLGGLVGGLFLGIALPPHLVLRTQEVLIRGFALFVFAGLFLLFTLLIFVGDPYPDWPYGPACPTL